MFKYSAAAGGFFHADINGEAIPEDAVDVSDEQHAALLAGQQRGRVIVPGADGSPTLADPPPPSRADLLRRLRYAVQRRLDVESRAHGFNGITDAVSYADEPASPSLQAKGRALRMWRSQVWEFVNGTLEAETLPTADDLVATLPPAPAR